MGRLTAVPVLVTGGYVTVAASGGAGPGHRDPMAMFTMLLMIGITDNKCAHKAESKVLVTGASGYVASHLVKQLQEAGHQVRGTVRSLRNTDKMKHLYDLCPNAAHKLELVEADLLDAESWTPAVEGMTHVMHVASPLPMKPPANEEEVIKPAVEGTLSVLRACAKSHTVKRVVFTSAGFVVGLNPASSGNPRTEADWADVAKLEGYSKSKYLAERAAWDFVKELPDGEKFELSVIIPCAVLGPPLHNSPFASMGIVQKILSREMPAVPKMNLPMIDVRDVAQAHVRAMTLPEAAGNRFICYTDSIWMSEIAALLKFVFEPQVVNRLDNTKMREVLKIQPRDIRDTIIDTAYGLIEKGFVAKTSDYRGPGGPEERQRYRELRL
ncbi:hypothetical protein BaRGS_00030465 [Batillaria attramentaria]|uniref:NAD-dependent epimerase/dehydratase domain-containing protein n=1 Tax=Batillaria attramentaria TaxID=370345 RepID=A0ABD0JTW8_9CAEN